MWKQVSYESRSLVRSRPADDQVSVIVDEEADFEVINVTGELVLGEEGIIHVTYKNVGEEAVKDATVRISSDDLFSTTDDQSFIRYCEDHNRGSTNRFI